MRIYEWLLIPPACQNKINSDNSKHADSVLTERIVETKGLRMFITPYFTGKLPEAKWPATSY
jgi:hypothetical protein